MGIGTDAGAGAIPTAGVAGAVFAALFDGEDFVVAVGRVFVGMEEDAALFD